MAEITDTSGYRPNLQSYRSKGITRQNAPTNPNAGIVEAADAKMWDSITNSLEKVITVKAKMDHMALDLEKQKLGAEINKQIFHKI